MKCEICGRDYIALGVHLRHKHKVDPDEYRDEFGLLRTQPLVDADLSEQIRKSALQRLQDPEYREEVSERCKLNAQANKGRAGPGMSQAGKEMLAQRNRESNDRYLRSKAQHVAEILDEKKTMKDVRLAIGMGAHGVRKIVEMGQASYSLDVARQVGRQRAVEAYFKNKLAG